MNSFELRQRNRKVKLANQRADRAFASFLEVVGVQSFFEDAFNQLYGRSSGLVYKSGWFHLQGKRYSRKKIEQRAMMLWAKIQENSSEST